MTGNPSPVLPGWKLGKLLLNRRILAHFLPPLVVLLPPGASGPLRFLALPIFPNTQKIPANEIDGLGAGLYITSPFAFQSSSMVEHAAVNRVVEGSSPSSGASFASRWRTTTAHPKKTEKSPKNGQVCSKVCSNWFAEPLVLH